MRAVYSTIFMQISVARSKTASMVLATAELECARLGGRAARSLCQNSAKLRQAWDQRGRLAHSTGQTHCGPRTNQKDTFARIRGSLGGNEEAKYATRTGSLLADSRAPHSISSCTGTRRQCSLIVRVIILTPPLSAHCVDK